MKIYTNIVFMQGDDYDEAEGIADAASAAALDDAEDALGWPSLFRGCAEWVAALFEHLMQWEYGEGGEEYDNPPHGSGNDVAYFTRSGESVPDTEGRDLEEGYLMSWDTRYAHCGLVRIETRD